VTLISAANVLAIDAATFAVSAIAVASVVPAAAQPPRDPHPSGEASYLASLREGLDYLRRDHLLLGIAAMFVVSNLVDQAGGAVLFPVWANRVMHSATALGLLGGAFSLGAVTGNVLTTWLGPRLPRRLVYGAGFFLAGVPRFLATAFLTGLAPILGAVFVSGLGAGCINPILGAVQYERVPRQLQARVLGTVGALAFAGIPFGGLIAGSAVTVIGIRAALIAAALVYGLAALPTFIFPAWREMERRPEPAPKTSHAS
jgi:MFS family permease